MYVEFWLCYFPDVVKIYLRILGPTAPPPQHPPADVT
jgi:hypothetical protein